MKLNLGAGNTVIDGYTNLDGANGDSLYPLHCADGSVDEIRASHVLEHFPQADTAAALKDWTRALKPGGLMKIAVPNLDAIIEAYQTKQPAPIAGYLMGGQTTPLDFHKAVFNADTLSHAMREAGLISINGWESEIQDCAALPVSLNLMGWKRPETWPKTYALMSVPRLGFMDAFFCWHEALVPLRIPVQKYTGAFWGQCLERGFDQVIREHDPEFLLTLDYDTVFTAQDIEDLLCVMVNNPDIDALAPIQAARSRSGPLMTIAGSNGRPSGTLDASMFFPTHCNALTAHFGCTLIRASALKDLARPWFWSRPGRDGAWGDGREDEDIYFWKRFAEAGKRLCIANRVAVGHLELMIRWPGDNETMAPVFQHHTDFSEHGMPEGVWQ